MKKLIVLSIIITSLFISFEYANGVPLKGFKISLFGGPPFAYTNHAPISYSGVSNVTISNYNITGGSTYCIFLINCHDIHITKNYCQGSSKTGIFVQNCYNIYIDSNLVTNCHVGIEAITCTNNIRIVYNQLLNIVSPTLLTDGSGNSIEFYQNNGTGLEIDSNVIEHTSTATIDGVGNGAGDNIDILQCNGTASSPIRCYYNWIRGGGTYVLGNGRCGIGIGDLGGSYQDCEDNVLVNTGWGGIQLAGGAHIKITQNKIYSANLAYSLVGLHSFITGTGVTAANDTIEYNQVNWMNGYVGTRGDTVYSSAKSNPLPYGFRTTNTINAPITSSILPVTIITFIIPVNNLVLYPPPVAGFSETSNIYQVSVTQNGVTQQSFVYESSAGNSPATEWGNQINNNFHFTTFSFSGTATVNVTKLNSSASTAIVRPNSLTIGTINTITQGTNKTISFTLNKPAKLSVEFNDDPNLKDALMIFADAVETPADVPSTGAANVLLATNANSLKNIPASKTIVYFQTGVDLIGVWNIPSTIQQVYIPGGAYVKGYLNWSVANNAHGIIINGRGIISDSGYPFHYPSTPSDQNSNNWYRTLSLTGGQNNLIEGLTLIESTGYNIFINANNTAIQNVNINGFRYNNNGITAFGSGITINNCFIRDNDDAITLFANNVGISNCVLWQLQGSEIQLGWTPHSIENININNMDILHDYATNSEGDVGFINAMNYSPTSVSAAIDNVVINNISFDTPILRFLDVRADRNGVNSAATQNIWVYRNFNINGVYFNQSSSAFPLIYLHGYDANHPAVNFTFQNLYFNSVKVTPAQLNSTSLFSQKNIFGIQFK